MKRTTVYWTVLWGISLGWIVFGAALGWYDDDAVPNSSSPPLAELVFQFKTVFGFIIAVTIVGLLDLGRMLNLSGLAEPCLVFVLGTVVAIAYEHVANDEMIRGYYRFFLLSGFASAVIMMMGRRLKS